MVSTEEMTVEDLVVGMIVSQVIEVDPVSAVIGTPTRVARLVSSDVVAAVVSTVDSMIEVVIATAASAGTKKAVASTEETIGETREKRIIAKVSSRT